MSERDQNRLGGLLCLVLGIATYLVARQIPRRLPVGIDSGFLPELVAALIAILGGYCC